MPIQDSYTLIGSTFGCELIAIQIIKVMCACIFFGLSILPYILIGADDPSKVGGIYLAQLIVLIVPLMFCSFCMMTVYDKLVYAINDKFGFNE
jgi:FtsH-binding integral membrane protein